MTLLADPETGHTLLALHPLAAEPAAAGGWPAPPPPQAPQDWGVHQAVRSVYAVTLQRVELARAA